MATYFCSTCKKELSKSHKAKHERTNIHQRLLTSHFNDNSPLIRTLM